ncbi:hypothetical protein KP509_19G046800 [Ceratopteris richardii]|uniref:Uncharacterized protein n=1 Tax=Ceratopteris richardii TaxID=49495 RepID=A0A8T2SP82_CERRI|nr:hypothetical protein KP509_19G046800 [Ceratopteris richardii]
MAPPNSCERVDSFLKPPAPGKASSAKARKRKSRAKPKPFVKQLVAYNEINFKALVLAHTGVASPPGQASRTSPSCPISEISDSFRVICDSSELQSSRDFSSSGYKHSLTTPECSPESCRAPKTCRTMQQSSYMPQFSQLVKSMSLSLSNSDKFVPSLHSEAEYMMNSDVSSELHKPDTHLPTSNVYSQDIWARLLHQIMHLGSISSKVAGCLSSEGNTSEADINTLLSISCLTLLNRIAIETIQNGL